MQVYTPYCRRAAVLILPLLLFAAPACADQADAFNFSVGGTRSHDDNVFRLSSTTNAQAVIGSSERGDTINSQFVSGSFNKLVGRQQLSVDLNLTDTRYDRFTFLDYKGGSAKGAFNWRLTDIVSGSIGKTRTRNLYGFGDFRSPVQNIVTTDSEYANLDLWLDPDWHLEGSLRRNTAKNGSALNRSSDSTTDIVTTGVRYTPRSGSSVLLRAITTEGKYPNLVFVSGSQTDNSYSQKDIGFDFSWLATGQSRFTGTLNQTSREHRNVKERDFTGVTGGAGWEWMPTGATSMLLRWRRDLGGIGGDPLASYIVTDVTTLRLNWTPTAKLMVSAVYEQRDRNYAGDPVAILDRLEKRRDRQEMLNLGVSYQLDSSLLLSANLVRDQRQSNYAGMPYLATTRSLTAQFSF